MPREQLEKGEKKEMFVIPIQGFRLEKAIERFGKKQVRKVAHDAIEKLSNCNGTCETCICQSGKNC